MKMLFVLAMIFFTSISDVVAAPNEACSIMAIGGFATAMGTMLISAGCLLWCVEDQPTDSNAEQTVRPDQEKRKRNLKIAAFTGIMVWTIGNLSLIYGTKICH